MSLRRIFKPRPARVAGQALYEAATIQARQPAFYERLGAPDTVEGRFELYSLHVVLLLNRLKGEDAGDASQALFDTYVSALDNTLREMGVGDLTVPKKMRKLGQAFYGRAKAYDSILPDRDRAELTALLERTVYDEAPSDGRERMADYVLASVDSLAAQPLQAILEGQPKWAAIP